ncbi:MAG: baseplate J/gp47 family protein [Litorilinea sp.]
MSVTILNVPLDAGIEAIRRQLAQARALRVALVLPEGWSELDNPARMRLVQRQAQAQKCHLALVTRDEVTRKIARQVGVPVFARLENLESATSAATWHMHPAAPLIHPRNPAASLPDPPPWRREEIVKRTARPSLHATRLRRIHMEERNRRPLPYWLRFTGYVAMGALVATLVAFFALYVLPAATITLAPGRAAVAVTVQLTADPTVVVADFDDNRLPARRIEKIVEASGVIPTTGSEQKPTERATGTVVFSNLGTTPVPIPSGTSVNTSTGTPIDFVTTAHATLEGGVGARVTVPVQAVEEGTTGNVRANTINTVSGALRFRVRVSNPNGTFGGGTALVRVVTQTDRDQLAEIVQADIEARAYEELLSEVNEGEWLPPQSVQTFVVNQGQQFDKFNDDEGDELRLTLRMRVQGTAMNESETGQVMLAAVRRAVPEHGMLIAETVRSQRTPGADAIGSAVQFTMTGQAEYVVPIEVAEVKRLATGLTPEAAIQAISQRWPLAQPPQIYRDPEWMSTLPGFGSRIQVRFDYEPSATAQTSQP